MARRVQSASPYRAQRRRSTYGPKDDRLSPETRFVYSPNPRAQTASPDESNVRFYDGRASGAEVDDSMAYFEQMQDGTLRLLPHGSIPKGRVVVRARKMDADEKYKAGNKYVVLGNTTKHGIRTPSRVGRDIPNVVDNYAIQQNWFQRDVGNVDELEDELQMLPSGCFFIRDSRQRPDSFILTHVVDLVIHNWLLLVDEDGVGLRRSNLRFPTLTEFVRHYANPRQTELPVPLRVVRRRRVVTRDVSTPRVRRVVSAQPRPPSRRVRTVTLRPRQRDWRTVATFETPVDGAEAERLRRKRDADARWQRVLQDRLDNLEDEIDTLRRRRPVVRPMVRTDDSPPRSPRRADTSMTPTIHIHIDGSLTSNGRGRSGGDGDYTEDASDDGVYVEEVTTTRTEAVYADDDEPQYLRQMRTEKIFGHNEGTDTTQTYRRGAVPSADAGYVSTTPPPVDTYVRGVEAH